MWNHRLLAGLILSLCVCADCHSQAVSNAAIADDPVPPIDFIVALYTHRALQIKTFEYSVTLEVSRPDSSTESYKADIFIAPFARSGNVAETVVNADGTHESTYHVLIDDNGVYIAEDGSEMARFYDRNDAQQFHLGKSFARLVDIRPLVLGGSDVTLLDMLERFSGEEHSCIVRADGDGKLVVLEFTFPLGRQDYYFDRECNYCPVKFIAYSRNGDPGIVREFNSTEVLPGLWVPTNVTETTYPSWGGKDTKDAEPQHNDDTPVRVKTYTFTDIRLNSEIDPNKFSPTILGLRDGASIQEPAEEGAWKTRGRLLDGVIIPEDVYSTLMDARRAITSDPRSISDNNTPPNKNENLQ